MANLFRFREVRGLSYTPWASRRKVQARLMKRSGRAAKSRTLMASVMATRPDDLRKDWRDRNSNRCLQARKKRRLTSLIRRGWFRMFVPTHARNWIAANRLPYLWGI